jgi:hypothetical protein
MNFKPFFIHFLFRRFVTTNSSFLCLLLLFAMASFKPKPMNVTPPLVDAYVLKKETKDEKSSSSSSSSSRRRNNTAVSGFPFVYPMKDHAERLPPWPVYPISSAIKTTGINPKLYSESHRAAWADACDKYSALRTSDALYQYHILHLPPNQPSVLSTNQFNNLSFLLQATNQIATTFKDKTLYDTYFSALSVVVLQYWAFVNERFLVYTPTKRDPHAEYALCFPAVLLMLFPDYDKTAPNFIAPKKKKKTKNADESVDSKETDIVMNTSAPAELIAATDQKYKNKPHKLPDLVKGQPFNNALLLVARYYLKLEEPIFKLLLLFADDKVHNWRLFITSRGFNIFPFADIDFAIRPLVLSRLTSSSTELPTIKRVTRNWHPQQKQLWIQRYEIAHSNEILSSICDTIPQLCGHFRFSAFHPILDSRLAVESKSGEVTAAAKLASLLEQLRIIMPMSMDDGLKEMMRRVEEDRAAARLKIMTHSVDGLALRCTFIRDEQTLFYSPPLQVRYKGQPLSECSPLVIQPTYLRYAYENTTPEQRTFVLTSVFDQNIDLSYIKVVYHRSSNRWAPSAQMKDKIDSIAIDLLNRFKECDLHPVKSNQLYDFYRAMLYVAGGSAHITCALLMNYVEPALRNDPVLLTQLLHDQYRQYLNRITPTFTYMREALGRTNSRFINLIKITIGADGVSYLNNAPSPPDLTVSGLLALAVDQKFIEAALSHPAALKLRVIAERAADASTLLSDARTTIVNTLLNPSTLSSLNVTDAIYHFGDNVPIPILNVVARYSKMLRNVFYEHLQSYTTFRFQRLMVPWAFASQRDDTGRQFNTMFAGAVTNAQRCSQTFVEQLRTLSITDPNARRYANWIIDVNSGNSTDTPMTTGASTEDLDRMMEIDQKSKQFDDAAAKAADACGVDIEGLTPEIVKSLRVRSASSIIVNHLMTFPRLNEGTIRMVYERMLADAADNCPDLEIDIMEVLACLLRHIVDKFPGRASVAEAYNHLMFSTPDPNSTNFKDQLALRLQPSRKSIDTPEHAEEATRVVKKRKT